MTPRRAEPLRRGDPAAHDPGRPGCRRRPDGLPAGPGGAHRAAPRDIAPPPSGRRQFLVTGSVAVAAAGASALVGRVLAERSNVSRPGPRIKLPPPSSASRRCPPGVDLHIPGLSPFVTPNSSFYRVDTALVLPQVAPSSWQLRIHGMVAHEITLTFDDLLKLPLLEDWITLCCVSNPVGGPYIGNALWLGASLSKLLRAAGIRAGAEQLLCTSVDGFTSGTPVQTVMDGRDALLAVAMNGSPLPVAHGFPARLVVPGLYGYVSACKWVTDIKVTTFATSTPTGRTRGWSQQAPIKTESRIDVPNGSSTVRAGRTPIAGVAWAQHKGIDGGRGAGGRRRLARRPGWRRCRASTPGGSGCTSGTPPAATTSSRPAPRTPPATPRPRRWHRRRPTAPPGTRRVNVMVGTERSRPGPRHSSWSRICPDR